MRRKKRTSADLRTVLAPATSVDKGHFHDPEAGRLTVAYFAAALYNMTEAAFKGMPLVWIVFLLAITVVPPMLRTRKTNEAPSPASVGTARLRAVRAATPTKG